MRQSIPSVGSAMSVEFWVPTEVIYQKLSLSEGDIHDRSNLIALCKSCHSRTHAHRGDRWHAR